MAGKKKKTYKMIWAQILTSYGITFLLVILFVIANLSIELKMAVVGIALAYFFAGNAVYHSMNTEKKIDALDEKLDEILIRSGKKPSRGLKMITINYRNLEVASIVGFICFIAGAFLVFYVSNNLGLTIGYAGVAVAFWGIFCSTRLAEADNELSKEMNGKLDRILELLEKKK